MILTIVHTAEWEQTGAGEFLSINGYTAHVQTGRKSTKALVVPPRVNYAADNPEAVSETFEDICDAKDWAEETIQAMSLGKTRV